MTATIVAVATSNPSAVAAGRLEWTSTASTGSAGTSAWINFTEVPTHPLDLSCGATPIRPGEAATCEVSIANTSDEDWYDVSLMVAGAGFVELSPRFLEDPQCVGSPCRLSEVRARSRVRGYVAVEVGWAAQGRMDLTAGLRRGGVDGVLDSSTASVDVVVPEGDDWTLTAPDAPDAWTCAGDTCSAHDALAGGESVRLQARAPLDPGATCWPGLGFTILWEGGAVTADGVAECASPGAPGVEPRRLETRPGWKVVSDGTDDPDEVSDTALAVTGWDPTPFLGAALVLCATGGALAGLGRRSGARRGAATHSGEPHAT